MSPRLNRIVSGKLGRKILARFVAIAIVPTVLTGMIGYAFSAMLIREQTLRILTATAGGIEGQLLTFIKTKKYNTRDFASDGFIRDGLERLTSKAHPEVSLELAKDLSEHLAVNKLPLAERCLEVFLLDMKGVVVASSDRINIGRNKAGRDYFLQAIKLPYGVSYIGDVHTAEEEGVETDSYYISAPVMSRRDGKLLGVLVNRFELSELTNIVSGKEAKAQGAKTQLIGLGRTGEVYIVNRDKLMLTSSNAHDYRQFTILCQLVDTEPVRQALTQGREITSQYKNYRGASVLGASMYIKETGWVIIVEQEVDEAYRPLYILQEAAFSIVFVTLILVAATSGILTNRIIRPIRELKEGVRLVGKGNLGHKLSIDTGDEIQEMAEAFNTMTDELAQMYNKLEASLYEGSKYSKELALKTKELDSANTELKKEKIAMMNLLEDINESHRQLRETQTQLLQSEKMAIVGQLAAGIAHEINNPMSFIISNLDTFLKYIEDLEKAIKTKEVSIDIDFILEDIKSMIAESLDGTSRIKRIVQDLKTFSHVDEADLQYTDIHSCIDSTLNIVGHELKYRVEVVKEYGNIPKVWCYPMQLSQVFLNLIMNASQAIDKQGHIWIRTKTDNKKVFIEIQDSGCGIPPEIIDKIFEPFFTTKEVGKGTGLGLSIAYNIIKNHKGEIKVASKVGEGTTFTIILPVEGRLNHGA